MRWPLDTLWNSEGHDLPATRGRPLDADAIKDLLRCGVRRFVVAGSGPELRWIEGEQCLDFWKSEARDHLHDEARPYLEDYPGGYFYYASEWTDGVGKTIILFEIEH